MQNPNISTINYLIVAAEYDDSCSNYSCSNDNQPINYNQPINCNGNQSSDTSLKFSPILVDNVISTLKALKTCKATGLDQIPAKILKLSADIVAPSLTFIFNLSLTTGIYVDEWKQARVTPIYKSGDKRLCENYRPISVLPIVSKAFEKEVLLRHQSTSLRNYTRESARELSRQFVLASFWA
jgi:hypothetical protein